MSSPKVRPSSPLSSGKRVRSSPKSSRPPECRRSDCMLKIDTHAHWYRPEWVKLIAREGAANGAEVGRSESGRVTMQAPGIRLRPIFSAPYVDLTLRLKLMLALLLKNAAAYAPRRQPARPVRALSCSM